MGFRKIDDQRKLQLQMLAIPLLMIDVIRLFMCLLILQRAVHCRQPTSSMWTMRSIDIQQSYLAIVVPSNFLLLFLHSCLLLAIHWQRLLPLLLVRLSYMLLAVALIVLLLSQSYWNEQRFMAHVLVQRHDSGSSFLLRSSSPSPTSPSSTTTTTSLDSQADAQAYIFNQKPPPKHAMQADLFDQDCSLWLSNDYLRFLQLCLVAMSITFHLLSLFTLDLHVLQKCAVAVGNDSISTTGITALQYS